MTAITPLIRHYGDNAVLVEWDTAGFNATVSDQVHALAAQLRKTPIFTEVMPGYDSLVVSFDAEDLTLDEVTQQVKTALQADSDICVASESRLVEIPVSYGGAAGPDLAALAERIGKTPQEVIALHSDREYRVCMMGFIPGFAFLSEVDPVLQHPRHATPRAVVPAGSVGIANWQTGIYGLDSPGGWQIIGRTDLDMFDAKRDAPFLVEAGDRIRFVPQ
ncbi:allophanate hydrolase [Algimonas arctica]|uniref:Allophanate hydrolase n=1 Tax=Algimonas arctica TaxID=1479486 RepID=A0A8J3G2Z5_9PROT|nr:5-oxoprolinase subunit PxpB [Algimonas arctica]GHB00879.1 allophanate hydrolase [Algimonas arctica]